MIKSYIFILTVLSLLLWTTQAARFLHLITENGISINSYVSYIIYLLPRTISQLMLLSLLISVFLTIIKFQNNKELDIYWISGISKIEIVNLIIHISLLITVISLIFYIFISPYSNGKSRQVLANSEYSIINSLVKQNNFNSPLKGVTIFVHKNDNKGNLEKIFIFENNKTIISKFGRVLNIKEKKFLELTNGIIHEKNSNNKITSIKFNNTLYDFTIYQKNFTTDLKVQERSTRWVFHEYLKTKNLNFLYEIHKRLFKPLFIPVIAILCCFILYANSEKINTNTIKITTFAFATIMLIFVEILLNLSILNNFYKYFLYSSPLLFFFIFKILLKKFLSNETISYSKLI